MAFYFLNNWITLWRIKHWSISHNWRPSFDKKFFKESLKQLLIFLYNHKWKIYHTNNVFPKKILQQSFNPLFLEQILTTKPSSIHFKNVILWSFSISKVWHHILHATLQAIFFFLEQSQRGWEWIKEQYMFNHHVDVQM